MVAEEKMKTFRLNQAHFEKHHSESNEGTDCLQHSRRQTGE